jgi:hypothetical protein
VTDDVVKPIIIKIQRLEADMNGKIAFVITDNLGHSTYIYDRPDTTTNKEISKYAVDYLGFIDRRKNATRI